MWYLLLTLYVYCGIVAAFVSCELERRRGCKGPPDSFGTLLQYSLIALICWPAVAGELHEEWTK